MLCFLIKYFIFNCFNFLIMKFFLPFNNYPGAKSDIDAYDDIADAVEHITGQIVSRNIKIRSIEFIRDGVKRAPAVGEVFEPIGQIVISIFEGNQTYLVCSQDRGICKGDPYLVGLNEGLVKYFDNY